MSTSFIEMAVNYVAVFKSASPSELCCYCQTAVNQMKGIKEQVQLTCGCCPEAPVSLPSAWTPQRKHWLSGSTHGRHVRGPWRLHEEEQYISVCTSVQKHRGSLTVSVYVPRVSPMVTMAFCWTAGSPVSLESITARWGLQSPHFSFPQPWAQNVTVKPLLSW